jgi:hypothetical protein
MRVYEITFDHDTSDKVKVATSDDIGAFSKVHDWAVKKAEKIYKEMCEEVSKKEAADIPEVEIDTIEYLYHIDANVGLKIEAI